MASPIDGVAPELAQKISFSGPPIRQPTIGDAIAVALGGPKRVVHQHCKDGHHQVCMGYYGGRSCDCKCHREKRL